MTLYGVGLGPGDAELLTVRGRRILENADVVYTPGRLSRSVATEYVEEERIGDLDFPMTRDEDELRRAWREAAAEIAPRASDGTAAFVTLGDPNVYSTFGHLRRTLDAFHPEVELDVVPGVSAVTAFTTALGVEIAAGASLTLHEAARGSAPIGPDRMVLFKVTDVPATHERLTEAGYDVVYGRRLYMDAGETVVTSDPDALDERDYYTLAYAERGDLDDEPATATFDVETAKSSAETAKASRGEAAPVTTDGGSSEQSVEDSTAPAPSERAGSPPRANDLASVERAEGEACGDVAPEVGGR